MRPIGEDMKNFISVLILSASFSVFAEKAPVVDGSADDEPRRGFREIHNSFESVSLRLSLGDDLNGFIEGKVCDECKTIKVTITPATKAYENGAEVPLKNAKKRVGRYATGMYELDTKNVSAIRW